MNYFKADVQVTEFDSSDVISTSGQYNPENVQALLLDYFGKNGQDKIDALLNEEFPTRTDKLQGLADYLNKEPIPSDPNIQHSATQFHNWINTVQSEKCSTGYSTIFYGAEEEDFDSGDAEW